LLISPIDAARGTHGGEAVLDIRDLDQLKEKLVKVLVVALIASAFKAMLTLAISGFLVTGNLGKGSHDKKAP
jgi:hypothetical protein